jgi:hypothetical protein
MNQTHACVHTKGVGEVHSRAVHNGVTQALPPGGKEWWSNAGREFFRT